MMTQFYGYFGILCILVVTIGVSSVPIVPKVTVENVSDKKSADSSSLERHLESVRKSREARVYDYDENGEIKEEYNEFDYDAVNTAGELSVYQNLPEVSQTIQYPYYVITLKIPINKISYLNRPTVIEKKAPSKTFQPNVLFKGFSYNH